MSDPSSSHYGGVAMMRNIRSSPPASRAYGGTTAVTMASQQGHTTPLTLRGSDRMGEAASWDVGATSSSTPQTYSNATLRPFLQHTAHPQSPHTAYPKPMTDLSALSPESQSGELQFESEYLRALFRNERTQLSPESAAVLGLGAGAFTEHGSHRPLQKEQNGHRGSPVGYSVLSASSSVPDSGTPPLRRVSSLQTGASGSGERWKKGMRPSRPFNDGADKENARPEMLMGSGPQVQVRVEAGQKWYAETDPFHSRHLHFVRRCIRELSARNSSTQRRLFLISKGKARSQNLQKGHPRPAIRKR